MSTNVPSVVLGPNGYITPDEAQVLAGVEADLNAAFGGNLAFGNGSPETQLANSETAIIGNTNDQLLALFNGIDPAYAFGRMQDGIGRIYFMTRIAAQATVIQVDCYGLTNTPIPVGALLTDDATGDVYSCDVAGTIPIAGFATLQFSNTTPGPAALPTTLKIYRAIPGWDSATINSGVVGNAVESRAAFELRRQGSVAANSIETLASIRGAVLDVEGVLSCYTTENPNSYPIAFNPVAKATGAIAGTALTLSGTITGTVAAGQTVSGPGIAVGTTIISGSGTAWVVSPSQTAASAPLSFGGIVIGPNKLYVCVSGGTGADVAQAIWSKKGPGCGYVGNTTVVVYDTSPPYPAPGVPYDVIYQIASNLSLYLNVSLANNTAIPANALPLIQEAILEAFSGADGQPSVQIGFPVLVDRFYAGIKALGAWAQILSIGIGTSAMGATATSAPIRIDQMPATIAGNIVITLVG